MGLINRINLARKIFWKHFYSNSDVHVYNLFSINCSLFPDFVIYFEKLLIFSENLLSFFIYFSM